MARPALRRVQHPTHLPESEGRPAKPLHNITLIFLIWTSRTPKDDIYKRPLAKNYQHGQISKPDSRGFSTAIRYRGALDIRVGVTMAR
jgi:hypothetical protein